MNINTNYKALLEGRMSKSEFLRQARQGLPQYISNCTSFDDAVKILKQKSLLSEELVYQNKADKFPLESIQRGIVYELEEMEVLDVNSPSREEYKKARTRAIDNLCKDPLYYINKVAAATPQPKEDASDKMQKVKVNLKENQEEKKEEPKKEEPKKEVNEAAEAIDFSDPIFTQIYQHYLKKYKEEKRKNPEKEAREKAKISYKKVRAKHREKQAMKEHKEKMDKMLLKETVINLIGKILNEAATTNLAQLSDENASVAELPAAINNLENIVTEIESFWLKEQQKIQGVFDSLGNIKNEDGLPIGYKFVQPIMASLQKDLQPVLAKINLEGINLPEAPAPDQTPVNDPNNANPIDDPNAAPEVPEKKTVFSPAEKEPLQEGKKNRRYTK